MSAQLLTDWVLGGKQPLSPVESCAIHSGGASLIRANVSEPSKPRGWSPATFPELTIQVVTRGRLPFTADMGCGRFSAIATPGAFIVTPPNQMCEFRTEAAFETLALALPWNLVKDLVQPYSQEEMHDISPLYAGVNRSTQVVQTIDALWCDIVQSRNVSALRIQAGILRVISGLLDIVSTDVERGQRGGLSSSQLTHACEMMEANLHRDLTLTELAALVGLSPAHFSRAFKRSTKMQPSAWLLYRRIEQAKVLLRRVDMSLSEIALNVGFAAQPQFTTAFRRLTGQPPGAWRRARSCP